MSDKFRNQNDPADKIFDSIVRDPTRHRLEEAEKIPISLRLNNPFRANWRGCGHG